MVRLSALWYSVGGPLRRRGRMIRWHEIAQNSGGKKHEYEWLIVVDYTMNGFSDLLKDLNKQGFYITRMRPITTALVGCDKDTVITLQSIIVSHLRNPSSKSKRKIPGGRSVIACVHSPEVWSFDKNKGTTWTKVR